MHDSNYIGTRIHFRYSSSRYSSRRYLVVGAINYDLIQIEILSKIAEEWNLMILFVEILFKKFGSSQKTTTARNLISYDEN